MKILKKVILYILTHLLIVHVFIYNSFGYSLLSGISVFKSDEGVAVLDIKQGTPLENAGITKGDIILQIDEEKVSTMADFVKKSRELKEKKYETTILIKRDNQILTFVIKNYSIPIKEFWDEKVPFYTEKIPGKEEPYDYWIDQGKRKLDSIKEYMPFSGKIDIYRKAISNVYNALHYSPKMVMAVVLIADIYEKIGELFINEKLEKECLENFEIAIRLYKKAMIKISMPKENLKKIRENLKNIEKLLKQNHGL